MSTPVAIVVGFVSAAAILAVALLLTFRWEMFAVAANGDTPGGVIVLDRWIGQVVLCARRPGLPADAKGFATLDDKYAPPRKPGTGYLLDCRP